MVFKYPGKQSKNQTIHETHLQYSCILKIIVEYIHMHYTTARRAVNKIEWENEK